jgi:hypothetical protein
MAAAIDLSSLTLPARGCSASRPSIQDQTPEPQRLTFASSSEPCTLVVARLSVSVRRQDENRAELPGSLTTMRGDLDCPPVTVVERVAPSESVVPPSTVAAGVSHNGLERTVLVTGVPGAHGSVL